MGLRERLLADFDHEIASTRRLLMCLPDDRLSWTPYERSRTLGALVGHLVEVLTWATPILTTASFDLTPGDDPPDSRPLPPPLPASCAAAVGLFDTEAAKTRAALDRSDAEYKALWKLKRDGDELFVLPREAAFRAFVLHHLIHHRGQLTVYLRLCGVTLPAIYGPTADTQAG